MAGEYFHLLPLAIGGLAVALVAYFWRPAKPSKLNAWIAVVFTFAGSVWMGWEVFFTDEGKRWKVMAMLIFLGVFFLILKKLSALRAREP